MKRYTFLLFALFIMVFAVACGDAQAAEVDSAVSSSIAVVTGLETAENHPDPVQTMDEAVADSDSVAAAVADEDEEEIARPDGWSEETHGKSADPNYEVVFPSGEINTMTITIEPEEWQAMLDDMTATYGDPGSGTGPGGGPGGRLRQPWR